MQEGCLPSAITQRDDVHRAPTVCTRRMDGLEKRKPTGSSYHNHPGDAWHIYVPLNFPGTLELASPGRFVYSPFLVFLSGHFPTGGVGPHDPAPATPGDTRTALGGSPVGCCAVSAWPVCNVATRRCRSAGGAAGACFTYAALHCYGGCRPGWGRLNAGGVHAPTPAAHGSRQATAT